MVSKSVDLQVGPENLLGKFSGTTPTCVSKLLGWGPALRVLIFFFPQHLNLNQANLMHTGFGSPVGNHTTLKICFLGCKMGIILQDAKSILKLKEIIPKVLECLVKC